MNQQQAFLASMQAQLEEQTEFTEDNLDVNLNYNHVYRDQVAQGTEIHVADNIDDAISSLNEPEIGKHPEKRMKACWNKFVDDHYEEYRQEYPSLRRKQIINIMIKKWKKSPENPLNQDHRPYNS